MRELNTLPWMLQQGTAGRSGASFVYDIKIPTTVCVSVLKKLIKEVKNWGQFRKEKKDQSLIFSLSLFIADYPHT